jgi:protein phosphatase
MSHEPLQSGQSGTSAHPVPSFPLDIWGATDKGRQREGNEDSVYPHSGLEASSFVPSQAHLLQQGQLLVVADGVGGAQGGAQASQWAIRVAVEKYYELYGGDRGGDLRSAIAFANASLFQYLQSTGMRDAGCTMAAAVVHENMLYVANVGDSRVYVIRNGKAVQQTRDHTLTQQKLDSQLITPEEAVNDSGRNVLTRSIGAAETVNVDVFAPLQLEDGDIVLICSDGLTDMLADDEIARYALSGGSQRAAQRLVEAANARGGYDNISVVMARVGGKPAASDGPLSGLIAGFRQMPSWQKVALLAGGMLVTLAFCVMIALGFAMAGGMVGSKSTATPAPTATAEPTETAQPTATQTISPTSTIAPVVTENSKTSTPMPTATGTPTPVPPTSTPIPPTATPVPPTEKPSGGGGGGGEDPPKPPDR